MIIPYQKDQELLADIESADSVSGAIHVWWLGQSGFLIKWAGHGLLFDPYLSDSLTRKYDGTDRPHVRMTERALDPRRLRGVDVVTSSHNHTDHLDAETLLALKAANPRLQLVLPAANVDFARKRLGPSGPELIPVNDGTWAQAGPFTFHGIAAAHNEIERDEAGHCRCLGFVVTFGKFALYHSGDTLWHDSLVKDLRRWEINLAFLPINGHDPARGVAGNLDGFQAAVLAKAISATMVVPCHYHLFEFNTAEPDEFVDTCERLGQRYRVLQCGERFVMGTLTDKSAGLAKPTEAQVEDGWWV
ncbi:MAG: MBL fold metallo-hydrolase [Verrucomicrobiales bacterium]|nr:MBL fold metallo-hydrolase [Verrucomicrobiales bacterium]